MAGLAEAVLGEEAALFEDKVVAKQAAGTEVSGFDWHQVRRSPPAHSDSAHW